MTSIALPGAANLSVHVASGDALDVRRFTIEEQISTLFSIHLVVLCPNENIDFNAIVGQAASFTMHHRNGERTWSGIVRHFQQVIVVDEESGLSTYEFTIVPSLWLATQRRNHRMFQQLSELDIVRKLLAEWGVEPELRLSGTYKKRKYRVQYGESDYAFMNRMLEDAGISYHFREVEGASRLVLTDAPQAAESRTPIAFRDRPTDADRDHVTRVRIGQRVRPGRYTMRDHDYRLPAAYRLATSATQVNVPIEERLERFHYTPGAFLFGTDKGEDTPAADDKGKTRTDEQEGELVATRRLAAKRSSAKACTFDTNAHDIAPGAVLCFLDHPRADLAPDRRWLVVSSHLTGTPFDPWEHTCEARSAAAPFRPPLVTPKPKAMGVESATVVGPAGDEIHTDEFGRVRVHFHWDRESKMNDSSSCWIHVSQPWGGTGFGGTNLPRVGQEVIVDFLGGDPDRPVIVGRLYTNLQKTPYKLPDSKTQSGWKSQSSPGGGGFNEIRFEDAKGKEQVYMQAEKDLKKLVKNDEDVTIGANRTKTVGANDALTVMQDRTKNVAGNEDVNIGNNRTKTVGANDVLNVLKDQAMSVLGNVVQQFAMSQRVAVGMNRATQIGAIDSTMVGDTYVVMVSPPGESLPFYGPMPPALEGGGGPTVYTMKHEIIELDTGAGAKITMTGANITIEASTIQLRAKKDLDIESEGGAIVIKGGPWVKINPS